MSPEYCVENEFWGKKARGEVGKSDNTAVVRPWRMKVAWNTIVRVGKKNRLWLGSRSRRGRICWCIQWTREETWKIPRFLAWTTGWIFMMWWGRLKKMSLGHGWKLGQVSKLLCCLLSFTLHGKSGYYSHNSGDCFLTLVLRISVLKYSLQYLRTTKSPWSWFPVPLWGDRNIQYHFAGSYSITLRTS